MPLNHRAKFNAASFILVGENRNRKKRKKQTNSKRYIHTLPIDIVWIITYTHTYARESVFMIVLFTVQRISTCIMYIQTILTQKEYGGAEGSSTITICSLMMIA